MPKTTTSVPEAWRDSVIDRVSEITIVPNEMRSRFCLSGFIEDCMLDTLGPPRLVTSASPLRLMRTIWLAILVLVFGGCGGTEVHREPPEILGERKSQQGEVIQQLVGERTITRKPVLLSPDGPTKSIKYADKYVLLERDKTRHVVPDEQGRRVRNCGGFGR